MAQSNHPPAQPSTQNPNPRAAARAARLRQLRQEVRRAGSCFMDACEVLEGGDYATAARLVDGSERLLHRLAKLEKRAVGA